MIADELHEGTLLNERYRILRLVHQGGQGVIYLAEHVRLGTHVAVKEFETPPPEHPSSENKNAASNTASRLLVNLYHRNLAQVVDAFTEHGRFYMVMEYIEGVSLEQKLQERKGKPLDVALVVHWAVQIADVLRYLHEQRPPLIFHDLKPANVIVKEDDSIQLINYELVRTVRMGTKPRTIALISLKYYPPEAFDEQHPDPRYDIYTFGASLHHLLTGCHPATVPLKSASVRNINAAVPKRLSALVKQCMLEDIDSRPKSMQEVLDALNVVQNELPSAIIRTRLHLLPVRKGLTAALSVNTARWTSSRVSYLGPLLFIACGLGLFGYYAFVNRNHATAGQPVTLPRNTSARSEVSSKEPREPQADQKAVLPTTAPVGYVLLHPSANLAGNMEYRWEGGDLPKATPRPLPAPDSQGTIRLGVPANCLKPETLLSVQNTADGQIAHYPLQSLAARYQTAEAAAAIPPNLVGNGDFRDKPRWWKLAAAAIPANLQFLPLPPTLTLQGVRGHTAQIAIGTPTLSDGDASLLHSQVFLNESGTYRLRFWARADTEREIGVLTHLHRRNGPKSGLDSRVALSPRWQRYELPFSVNILVSTHQKQPVVFRFVPTIPAQKVFLAGSFNGWNNRAHPLARLSDGITWQATIPLEPGIYQYKFVADDRWYTDPSAPEQNDGSGNMNSVRTIESRPDRHVLSFLLGNKPGRVFLAGITLQSKDAASQKPSPEDMVLSVNMKAEDFAAVGNNATP